MLKSTIRWAAVIGWAAVIFAFSAQPGSRIPGGYSEIGHFVEYTIFGGLLVAALWPHTGSRASVPFAVLIASAYGITDEIHQAFVPGRTPDISDWGVDTLGALTGALALMVLLRWLAERRTSPGHAEPGQRQ